MLFTIIGLHIYHQDVTAIELEAQLESLKTNFDEKGDSTFAYITEKIRKLPKSSNLDLLDLLGLIFTNHNSAENCISVADAKCC